MDNGCGFDLSQVKQQGLSSLRERAKSLNALLQVISEPGQTVIQLTWSDDFALKSVPSSS
jgi:signal transduction histidine kinase